MGLGFVSIKDQDGAAVYLLHDGTMSKLGAMTRLADAIKRGTNKQVLVVSANEDNGRKIIDFYDISGKNAILIVRDDDQL
ncbi:MAG: hypothetical protein ABWX94_00035, partial [Candidatus Saccharimonadales bacterium]